MMMRCVQTGWRRAMVVVLIGLSSACGGGIRDVILASDSTDGSGDNSGDSANSGNSDNPGSPSGSYVAGEAFRLNPDAGSVSVLMDCKSDDNQGRTSFSRRDFSFDPATAAFFVDRGRVFDGGFTWSPRTNEFHAERAAPIGTATGEYVAKVSSVGLPTYYRYKLTLRDFSFQQIECYQGIAG